MRRSLAGVLTVVLLAGCPQRDTGSSNSSSSGGGGGSSSSSSSSSSSGGGSSGSGSSSSSSSGGGSSSSSSGGTSGGAPIPLDQLCDHLARGYLRYATVLMSSLVDPACNPALTEEEFVMLLFGDAADARAALCSVDGGPVFAAMEDLQRGITAGRVAYDPARVGNCVADGRAYVDARGGILQLFQNTDAGAMPSLLSNCQDAIRGLQTEGEACRRDAECSPHDAGVECVVRTGSGCEGTCRRHRLVGEECLTGGHPACAPPAVCLLPGDGRTGVCAPPAGANQNCDVDGGRLGCPQDYRCSSGRCLPQLPAGTGCSNDADCLGGLRCEGTPKRCGGGPDAGGVGAACQGSSPNNAPCQRCLSCFPGQPDGGGLHCVAAAARGASCAAAPCEVGSICSNGTCLAPAATGSACGRTDQTDDEDLRGNCADPRDACTGSPATCVRRSPAGSNCTTDALPGSLQGSCLSGLRCARSSAAATTGTCINPPTAGGACGDTPGTHSSCPDNMGCRFTNDAGVGACGPYSGAAQDSPCQSDYDCLGGLFCYEDGGTVGRCAAGGALGSVCGYGEPTHNACSGGYCKYGGADAGYTSHCSAFEALNAPCSESDACGPDGRCDGTTSTCLPRLALGVYCNTSSECRMGMECRDSHCVDAVCEPFLFSRGADSCADGTWLPVLLLLGLVIPGTWRRRR